MKRISEFYEKSNRQIKIVQFGEGNFLRGFVGYLVDAANENGSFDGDIAVVKPRRGNLDAYHNQNNLYTVSLRGLSGGKVYVENRLIRSVQKAVRAYEDYDAFMELARLETLEYIVSNTTEAGIVYDDADQLAMTPPETFPAKLTKFLYERFVCFDGAADKGLMILPLELIEANGEKLKSYILRYARAWKLGYAFAEWIDRANVFCNTLVDRIVTGYPKDEAADMQAEFGYEDALLTGAEPFGLWVIESQQDIARRFPLRCDTLSIVFTKELKSYRDTKVRILNGAHTSMVLAAYLAGKDDVLGCMEDPVIFRFLEETVRQEILPTVELPAKEAEAFADAVFERFRNPFVRHSLLAIALNSVSKWRTRLLPTFKDVAAANGRIPKRLAFSFAALTAFYAGTSENGTLIGTRQSDRYQIQDDPAVLEFFAARQGQDLDKTAQEFLAKTEFWGEDLTTYPGFAAEVAEDLRMMQQLGMAKAIENRLEA